jgi:hypothetical protein
MNFPHANLPGTLQSLYISFVVITRTVRHRIFVAVFPFHFKTKVNTFPEIIFELKKGH